MMTFQEFKVLTVTVKEFKVAPCDLQEFQVHTLTFQEFMGFGILHLGVGQQHIFMKAFEFTGFWCLPIRSCL